MVRSDIKEDQNHFNSIYVALKGRSNLGLVPLVSLIPEQSGQDMFTLQFLVLLNFRCLPCEVRESSASSTAVWEANYLSALNYLLAPLPVFTYIYNGLSRQRGLHF